ncbi:hypothetical protein [Entomospira culicis]|uniref:Uncharacterized protein n=1 Tax=Entomospira culicis TaxID=2719989 RepID=A0A968KWU3_9SPIO|nr:hypothetical protein [Entomospira culicis]NIZ19458.1 hypothetical protein [Entomospira culicis]NIZ69637.1 hypothetical protein [Entomospira culicis]WDI36748.1 hypothetical protein PVA46_05325 [Entomospira culicis]WDI38377.1 hypothetical protein PVA47_05335 [Entomospira culicis]
MARDRRARRFMDNRAKRGVQRRRRWLVGGGGLILLLTALVLGWLPHALVRYAYMESDPIHQPYPQIYAVVSDAPLWLNDKKKNEELATRVAKQLGYRDVILLESREEVAFSEDFLAGWSIATEVIAQDFATRPLEGRAERKGFWGLYYFFNEMDLEVLHYLESAYPQWEVASLEIRAGENASLRRRWSNPITLASHHVNDGIYSLVVWDSALNDQQRRSPYSVALEVAQSFSHEQDYDGFILLNYRYVREYQLDFDIFPIKRSQVEENLQALHAQGYAHAHADILYFR